MVLFTVNICHPRHPDTQKMRLQLQQAKNNKMLAPVEHRIAPVEPGAAPVNAQSGNSGAWNSSMEPVVEPVVDTVDRGYRDLAWIQAKLQRPTKKMCSFGVKYLKTQIAW